MQLSSLSFMMLFLPVFLFIFLMTPVRFKPWISLGSSLLFYFISDFRYFGLFVLVLLYSYLVSLKVNKNKVLLVIYVLSLIGLLFFFKYPLLWSSFIDGSVSLIMPLGISYYIFEALSYVFDVYYGKYEHGSFRSVISYIGFFPTILSGPIIRYDDYKEYEENVTVSLEGVGEGLRRFMKGVIKKILIADRLVGLYERAFSFSTVHSSVMVWFGLIGFALRLYYDFSACSDMAIGVSRMMGFTVKENFNDPYDSLSISEFWRRWHISLGSFFRDYVYIPLGGNRVSLICWIRNIFAVWILTGLWHGSSINFLLWGLYYGCLLVIERLLISRIHLPKIISWLYTTFFVLVGWLLFYFNDIHYILHFGKRLFFGEPFVISQLIHPAFVPILPIYVLGLLLLIPFVRRGLAYLNEKCWLLYDVVLVLLFALAIVFIIGGSQAISVYFGF